MGGGSWAGDMNDCWEACFGQVESVVSQLTDIVNAQKFDGIDIDYEYFHTSQSAAFLKDLTVGLRRSLGSGKIIYHAPMDGDVEKGKPYFEVLKEVASSLDYVLPQYYNGPFRPAQSLTEPLGHMGDLINGIFSGDQSKVIFGFCLSDCSGTGSNVNSEQAVSIVRGVSSRYPNNGGAFLWAASDDDGWSGPVADALGITGGSTPRPAPIVSPTPATPTPPGPAPEQGNSCTGEPCEDVSHCRSKWGYCGPSNAYCNAESGWKAGATRKRTTHGAALLGTEAVALLHSAPRTWLLQCCSFQEQDASRLQNAMATKFLTQCFSSAVEALHERTATRKQMLQRMVKPHAKLRVKICRSISFILLCRLILTQRYSATEFTWKSSLLEGRRAQRSLIAALLPGTA